MKIGLLITSIGNFGQKGFYNAQEIGLAKELDQLFEQVIIYKLVPKDKKSTVESLTDCKNVTIKTLPSKNFGINGIVDLKQIEKNLDVLVYFSDTQLSLSAVYKWTKINNICFLPYIGVVESHSTNLIKKKISDLLFKRNLNIYKKCRCLVKTPQVKQKLANCGVYNTTVAPVGLDFSLLKADYKKYCIGDLKKKYEYQTNEKVILFIGRLVDEKQPLRMIKIFSELFKIDKSYRLLVVGVGKLRESMDAAIKSESINTVVKVIDKIPNNEIWELYRIAHSFINLNQQEIFGMAILEAMFYECKVIAWKASGPNLIIENEKSGYLVESNQEVIEKIIDKTDVYSKAHNRIIDEFTWANTSKIISNMIMNK